MRLFTILLLSCACLASVPPFYLHDGDTVVFYGDSITDHRLYTVFVETYVLTRFPELHIRFIHSGWGGDRVSGGGGGPIDLRLERDVFAWHPTVMTILLGMNDGEYEPWSRERYDRFAAGYRHILDSVAAKVPGVRVTLLEPSPYDDVTRATEFPGGYNAVLLRYGQFVRDLARQRRFAEADLNQPVVSLLECAKRSDPGMAARIIPDRVHPSQGGHLVMAEAILKAWHAPSIVSEAEIDAASGRLQHAEQTAIAGIEIQDGILSWIQTDRALPMPVESDEESLGVALRCSDFTAALNRQELRIHGLTVGSYRLEIDGEPAGRFSSAALAEGVNLAMLPTPMSRQAAAVRLITFRHNHVFFARWRLLETSLEEYHPEKLNPAVTALNDLETELLARQRNMAQPKPHRFRLLPVPK